MEECCKQGRKFIHVTHHHSTTSEHNSSTKFYENPTKSLVADSIDHTDGLTWSPQRPSIFYFLKNAWQMLESATDFISSDTSPRLPTQQ